MKAMKAKKTRNNDGTPTGGILAGIFGCLMNTRLRRGGAFAVTIAVHIVLLFFTALALDVKANPLEMPANIFKLADIRETAPPQAAARAPTPPRPARPTPVPPPTKPPAPRPKRETPPPPKPVEPEAVPVPVPVKEPEPIAETVVEVEEEPVKEEPVKEVAEPEEVAEEPAEHAEEAAETEAEETPAPVEVAAAVPSAAPLSGGPPVQTAETYLPQNQVSVMPVFNERDIRSRLVYPPIALRSGIEGTVYLELYIDSGGNVRRVEILKEDPTGRGFGEAAVNAFTGLRGKPAEANGKLVAVRYRYPVRFKISAR
jgi:protein TonB